MENNEKIGMLNSLLFTSIEVSPLLSSDSSEDKGTEVGEHLIGADVEEYLARLFVIEHPFPSRFTEGYTRIAELDFGGGLRPDIVSFESLSQILCQVYDDRDNIIKGWERTITQLKIHLNELLNTTVSKRKKEAEEFETFRNKQILEFNNNLCEKSDKLETLMIKLHEVNTAARAKKVNMNLWEIPYSKEYGESLTFLNELASTGIASLDEKNKNIKDMEQPPVEMDYIGDLKESIIKTEESIEDITQSIDAFLPALENYMDQVVTISNVYYGLKED